MPVKIAMAQGSLPNFKELEASLVEEVKFVAGPVDTPVQIAELTAQRDAALRRAELAEYRERATQDRTANQIDTLRQRLRHLGADPYA